MRPRFSKCVVLWILVLSIGSLPAVAGTAEPTDGRSAAQKDRIITFNLTSEEPVSRSAWIAGPLPPDANRAPAGTSVTRRSVGSALSPDVGIGVGVSVDQTYDDAQYTNGQGRHLAHWWNGETGGGTEFSVHLGYRDWADTTPGAPNPFSGYNVYNAVGGGDWPRGQEAGCELQAVDSIGWGGMPSLAVMNGGRVVMGATSAFYRSNADGSRLVDNMIFYQDTEFGCTYDPRSPFNVTWIDTTAYRPLFLDQSDGNYARDPQVATQWDGSNTIVHVLLGETGGASLDGDSYVNGATYHTYSHYRKVGDYSSSGSWSAGQIIDSLWFPWASMTAAPYPLANVAVTYTNPSYYGALLNNPDDLDVWLRESLDCGLTWQVAEDITTYTNAIEGDPNHFTAWLETQCLYDTDGYLHVIWTAKPTSNDPYFDGFNWGDFDQNIYHWSRSTDEIVQVAIGSFEHLDDLCGDMNTIVCGFGGSSAGYIANINLSQCEDKLYCIWNQIHERAVWNDWRCVTPQPAPGVLDDCSYTGDRLAMANWEILMSVANLSTTSVWDMPRNISDTYTPDCGLPGDPEASGPCGSEYKPSAEPYGFDEAGLSLTWPPEALVDMTPDYESPYAGTHYLNMQYLDDQFPGPAFWGLTNPPASLNSIKWIRLACVEPVEAALIRVQPRQFQWPMWVELGMVENLTVTVINDGNVLLNVTEIGTDDDGGGWLSVTENPTPASPFQVTAGLINTGTFDIVIDAAGLSANTWLDGTVWLKSDAANADSVAISIHLLAATEVEPVVWDTVKSHENMFDIYFEPEGECVALAVGNFGEIGWGHGTSGGVNLDYMESGLECGDREEDAVYLQSGSAFAILADDAAGTNAELTCSYNDGSQADETGWDPIGDEGSLTGGLAASGAYDSVYTGRFVNRDTSIAMERVYYTPRSTDPYNETINFVICATKFYSGDGAPHNHLAVGNVCDWNVPSEQATFNTSAISGAADLLYVRGTDTTGFMSCQSHTTRFATEAFGGSYNSFEWEYDNCANGSNYYSVNALAQSLLQDTTHYRNGTDLFPDQPLPDVWWDETQVPGLNADATAQDQAVWLTYVHDFNLGATDTLYYWTVLSTVRDGTLSDLEDQVSYARDWYTAEVRGCPLGCCIGQTGDANGSGDDEPTIGDISALLEDLFIGQTGAGYLCTAEADVDASGGGDATLSDITVRDVAVLIDYLFVHETVTSLPSCYTPGPWGSTDEGATDSLIADYTLTAPGGGVDPTVAVALFSYNDSQAIRHMSAGLGWNTPKARLDSAAFSTNAYGAFTFYGYLYYQSSLSNSNANRRVQCSGMGSGPGITASPGRSHLATYYFTLTDWTENDSLCFDADPYLPILYVDPDMEEYAPVWSPPECIRVFGEYTASGDVDASGIVDIGDLTALIDYLYISHLPPTVPREGDLTGDCVLDFFDVQSLECLLFREINPPEACEYIDVYPAPTCSSPTPVFYDAEPEALGGADVIAEVDGLRVENVGTSGDDGVRLHATSYQQAQGMRMDLENVSLATPGAGITLSFSAYVEDASKSALTSGPTLQTVGMAGVTNVGGLIQITADFNPIGDPDVSFQTFFRSMGAPTGSATVTGGGVVATGTALAGDASVTHVSVMGNNPPAFSIRFDRPVEFTLATTPSVQLTGDEVHLVAVNATGSIAGLGPVDMTAEYIGWFGLRNIKEGACCLGFVGNANLDPTDAVTIGDISTMIDNLFISGRPLPCLEEADVNLSGTLVNPPLDPKDITIGDISILIDHLFIDRPALPVCQ